MDLEKEKAMGQDIIIEIIRLCRRIDENACEVYGRLARLEGSESLSNFWVEMSNEESEHIAFWKRAELVEGVSEIPTLFDDPEQVRADLEKALSRSLDLIADCEEDCSVANQFMLAYRMEFYLLHPAFEILFHLLGPTAGGKNPENEYDSHIAKFISMLAEQGNVTPELELLGETLQRLWKENRQLANQSTYDHLTGLLNRRGFFTFSTQVAYLQQRAKAITAVIMIDIDQFKSINDRFGHTAGDQVLKDAARILMGMVRQSDIVGRYGGEEFIVFLPEVSTGATASIAEGIRKAFEKSSMVDNQVTVSVGFAEATLGQQVCQDYNQLIRKADQALYQAKRTGRNKVVEYGIDSEQSQPD